MAVATYLHRLRTGQGDINIDLIAGMMNDTTELWKAAVHKAMEMQPDCVTIYQMEVPYNTGIYKQMQADGKVTAPVADDGTFSATVNAVKMASAPTNMRRRGRRSMTPVMNAASGIETTA